MLSPMVKKAGNVLIFSLLLFICPWHVRAEGPSFHPWDEPAVGRPAKNEQTSSAASAFLLQSLRFYQDHISPVIGARCPMYPSCSAYSILAIKKHGGVVGIVMTADRLIHESDEPALAPLIKTGDRLKFYDPVENNDFWWADKKRTDSAILKCK